MRYIVILETTTHQQYQIEVRARSLKEVRVKQEKIAKLLNAHVVYVEEIY